ncbi:MULTISPECIES: ImmA/IrrE family metallo-endopeptidase [unclassified Enterococcus]|uniref:ImmA/IrrE family metallo-endopeptidase n=1 Tax=unclassified Enterococcus TaxID=2608891 RepID=UPI0028FD641B|nr:MULTISPECIES: ImmA/IrrE family metallo-endopeptidase [unclassified Enterococcus]MDU0319001.1 ImmA/IrrE family metallo-endopeptidase [Enterococcus sp. 2STP]MDU0334487.1 ImmA/IrrE family metallo-endopeptidase [Enterococcus sp. 2CBP]MDU0350260.1 ImmA/IrrE family metallo-endopeptidase [Enterococcus sp. 3MOLP]
MVWAVDELHEIAKKIGTYNPFAIAEYKNVDIVFTDKLPENQMGLAVSELEVAFIKSYFREQPFSLFLCAHELTHVIFHDGIQAYYNRNRFAKGKIENEADKGAVYLLVNYYAELFPYADYFRADLILEYFDLPKYLFGKVEKEMKLFALEKINF